MSNGAHLSPGFESVATCMQRRARLTGQLARSKQPGAVELALTLAACSNREPCGSGACPVCQRAWRRAILREADAALAVAPLLRISWVPTGGLIQVGQLAAFDLTTFLASRRRAVQRALPGVVGFGGADLSLNTESNGGDAWQAHIYLMIEAVDSPDLRRRVRARCMGEPTAPRPVTFKQVTDRTMVLSYAVKAEVYRRSSYIDGNGCRNSSAQSLSAEHSVEASLYQHRWPPSARLLLSGLRLYHGGEGPRLTRLAEAVAKGQGSQGGELRQLGK